MCNRIIEHSDADFENVDAVVLFIPKFDEYGIKILHGGSSYIVIEFCPWCGEKLPESKRDLWFDTIERLNIDPWGNDVPEKYLTGEWYKN